MGTNATARDNVELMLEVFTAVERRHAQRFAELVRPDFEIHCRRRSRWPASSRTPKAEEGRQGLRWMPPSTAPR